jgi:hypothetical protein
MRTIGIIFFALLAAHVALLVVAPTPAPRPYRIARLALALGMAACLVVQMGAEWARRRRAKRRPADAAAADPNPPA